MAYLAELRINHGEYYALILLATAGMVLLVSAVDLVSVFLGIELMSIPIYVLAGFDRRKLRSNESALKYFLVGSFASALLLYGMALLYGATGHTDFEGIRAGFDAGNPLAMIGLGLVIVGFTFKISSVPFHQWTPDVYEGAPTSVTAWMSVTVKVAAFAVTIAPAPEEAHGLEGIPRPDCELDVHRGLQQLGPQEEGDPGPRRWIGRLKERLRKSPESIEGREEPSAEDSGPPEPS